MLWLKAWLETRWKLAWMLLIGAFAYGVGFAANRPGVATSPQRHVMALLGLSVLVSVIATIMLAGSGIETSSTRPGESVKGADGSRLFTLSLPVTRARLFLVRTVTGVIETLALLALFALCAWKLLPTGVANGHDALGSFALIAAFSLALYAISACLSTFCDEGWRIRGSAIIFVGLYGLSAAGMFPRTINFFIPLVSSSPLITHQIPWAMIFSVSVVTIVSFAAALKVIQKRDY